MSRFILVFIFIFTLIPQLAFANDDLLVGIATMDITPSVEDQIPLGGYGSFDRRHIPFRIFRKRPFIRSFRPSKGALDPIRAKAMYLKRPDKKLLFVGLDVVGVTSGMHKDLIKRLSSEGFDSSEVIISATHTHSGPAGLSNNLVWQIIAMDRFQKAYYERFLGQIVETVKLAVANARPADLHTLSFDTEGLQRNRRNRPIDPRANLLLARSKSGEWMGGLVNFAVHGTSLSAKNLFFSADVPGAIETELEQLVNEVNGYVRLVSDAQFIFVNGAEGDVSPAMKYRDLGLEFAKQTSLYWETMEPLVSEWTVKQQEIYIGSPKLSISKCVNKKWMPKKINLRLGRFISSKTLITQIHFGNLWFLTWPGEPTVELGRRLIEAAKNTGADDAWIFGLSNDHLAYFTTAEEYNSGGYEACSNFYGADGGSKIIDAHINLSHGMTKSPFVD